MDLHNIVSAIKSVSRDLGKTPTIVEMLAHSKVSKRQIQKHGWNNLVKMAGLVPNQNSQQVEPQEIDFKPPKILCFDIETMPILAHVWGLWENNVGLNQIERDWSILSWCAKFLDEDTIHYHDVRGKEINDDKAVCESIYKLIEKADILLGHNSDRFDIKKLNARFIYHDLDPIAPKKTIDTLKIARKYFKFTSNKLEYLATYLKCTPKSGHQKFAGFSMWKECMNGNMEAFEEMEEYNKQDVLTTIEIFDKLKKWDTSLNFQTWTGKRQCICGGTKFFKHGKKYNKSTVNQIWRCVDCGKTYTGKHDLLSKDQKRDFFK